MSRYWGSEGGLQDAGASAVARYAIEVESLPAAIELDLPKDPHAQIDQGHGPVTREKASYYFSVTVDVGRDGKVCASDLVQDYNRTGTKAFGDAPPRSHTIAVKEYGDSCRPLDH